MGKAAAVCPAQDGASRGMLSDPVPDKHFYGWKRKYWELCSNSASASWTIDFAQKWGRTKFTSIAVI